MHIEASEAVDIDRLEGLGALNFLSIDDLPVVSEGRPVDPDSIIVLDWNEDQPVFPLFQASIDDPFLLQVDRSGKRWVILTDRDDAPRLVLDADGFLRHVFLHPSETDPLEFCHRPVVVSVLDRFRHVAGAASVIPVVQIVRRRVDGPAVYPLGNPRPDKKQIADHAEQHGSRAEQQVKQQHDRHGQENDYEKRGNVFPGTEYRTLGWVETVEVHINTDPVGLIGLHQPAVKGAVAPFASSFTGYMTRLAPVWLG